MERSNPRSSPQTRSIPQTSTDNNNNRSGPPLRTYSKRVLKGILNPPSKRQRLEGFTEPFKPPAIETKAVEAKVSQDKVNTKKRSISDYFQPAILISSPSSSARSVFDQDSLAEPTSSSLSSSPVPEELPGKIHKVRTRRRISTRPFLPPLQLESTVTKMSSSKDYSKDHHSGRDSNIGMSSISGSCPKPIHGAKYVKKSARDNSSYTSDDDHMDERSPPKSRVARYDELTVGSPPSSRAPFNLLSRDAVPNYRSISSSDQVLPNMENLTVTAGPGAQQINQEGREERGAFLVHQEPRLVQQRLNFGDKDTVIKCRTCAMTFDQTVEEDVQAHEKFHKVFHQGISVAGLKFDTEANVKKEHVRIDSSGKEQYVLVVHANSSNGWKAKAVEALKMADHGLGTEETPVEELWASIPDPVATNKALVSAVTAVREKRPSTADFGEIANVFAFKVFLLVRGHYVVGCLLAERIAAARICQYVRDEEDVVDETKSARLSPMKRPAHLGVNKIWIHQDHRNEKLATLLINTARAKFIYGEKVAVWEVAFTQPTELGSHLAKSFMKGKFPEFDGFLWLQYDG